MKYFISTALLFISLNLLSQTNNDSLICLSKTQVIAAATKLRDCKVENMKYENLVHELKTFITDILNNYQNQESLSALTNCELYLNWLKKM